MSLIKILTKYDPPEKHEICQLLDDSGDIWSLGVILYDYLVCMQEGSIPPEEDEEELPLNLRDLSEDGRQALIASTIDD